MNILVIGGTGPLGGYIALHLQDEGHKVTISSRNKPKDERVFATLEWVAGDYLQETFSKQELSEYQAIIFAAGSDPRHVPDGEDADTHYLHANGVMVPKFAQLARAAGVEKFIHIGSFYPHVLPSYIETNAYVRSRHLAATRVCELSNNTFCAISLDAPFVVGMPAGMKAPMWMAYLSYARGIYADVPVFGPAGGTNFISVRSLAQAVTGALAHGQAGKAYLLGDENMSFAEFFEYFFRTLGNPSEVPSIDKEHPMLPDDAIMQGRGNNISYEPEPNTMATLAYVRNDVGPMIREMAKDVADLIGPISRVKLSPAAMFSAEHFALASKYCWAMDNNDKDVLRGVFSTDAVLVGPGFRHDGIDEIVAVPALLKEFFAATRHASSQQLVEVDGDSAIGETLCTASHRLRAADKGGGESILTWDIRYQDEFQRIDNQWRFSRRAIVLDWIELRAINTVIQSKA